MLANSEDNSDTGDLELIQHLNVTSSSLKILLQGKEKIGGWKEERDDRIMNEKRENGQNDDVGMNGRKRGRTGERKKERKIKACLGKKGRMEGRKGKQKDRLKDEKIGKWMVGREDCSQPAVLIFSFVEGIKVFKNLKKPGQLAFVAGLDKVSFLISMPRYIYLRYSVHKYHHISVQCASVSSQDILQDTVQGSRVCWDARERGEGFLCRA